MGRVARGSLIAEIRIAESRFPVAASDGFWVRCAMVFRSLHNQTWTFRRSVHRLAFPLGHPCSPLNQLGLMEINDENTI